MNEQVNDERNHAYDDRAPESTPRPSDNKAYANLQADPGGKPEQEGIDHQHEEPNCEDDESTGEELEDRPDEDIDQTHHSSHNRKCEPGSGALHRHEVRGCQYEVGNNQSDNGD